MEKWTQLKVRFLLFVSKLMYGLIICALSSVLFHLIVSTRPVVVLETEGST